MVFTARERKERTIGCWLAQEVSGNIDMPCEPFFLFPFTPRFWYFQGFPRLCGSLEWGVGL